MSYDFKDIQCIQTAICKDLEKAFNLKEKYLAEDLLNINPKFDGIYYNINFSEGEILLTEIPNLMPDITKYLKEHYNIQFFKIIHCHVSNFGMHTFFKYKIPQNNVEIILGILNIKNLLPHWYKFNARE